MCTCNMVLPKLWLEVIQKYWEKRVPTDYPKTSSEFALEFKSKEVSEAVKLMEDKLNTEESIITTDVVPEGQRVGKYLGTYDVSSVAGKLVLISPEKVSSSDIDVLAFHYNEEQSTWEKIEDAQIVDGYVYGTLESFSPIAVFTVKKDTVFDESGEVFGYPTYIANGIQVVVIKNDNGETIVRDTYGKETVITEDTIIVGGTLDGTSVASTYVFAKGVKIRNIKAGSYSEESVVKIDEVTCVVEDSEITGGITGGGFNCRVEKALFNIKNVKSNFFGSGESYWKKLSKDSNNMDTIGLGSNSWIKDANINIEDSEIDILYAGGNTGYLYVQNTDTYIKGGKYGYVTIGGSNGKTDNSDIYIADATVTTFQTVNRGIVDSGKATIKNCKIEKLFAISDSEDSSVNGSANSVHLDITGGSITLFVGNNGGEQVDILKAKEIIKALKISRTTEVVYAEGNTQSILKDIIRIK